MLNPGCPCREVVRQVQAFFALHDLGPVDEGTGGYCQARGRRPLDTLQRLRGAGAAHADKLLPQAQQLWSGLRPKVIDGSTSSLPDTKKNQRAYPQSRSQKPGGGFPRLKLVGIFSLASGVWLDDAKGHKHQHELALLRKLLDHFKPGDRAVADRGFCSYALIGLLFLRNVASLFRLHQARAADLRQGQRLGMEKLSCQSPKMVHQELEMFFIAYNLIRALAVEASALHNVPGDRISFKGTVDASRQYSIAIAQARSQKKQRQLVAELLSVLALDQVPDRPGRREPRAVKRRPKPYPLLNRPRHQFKEIPHRSAYRKAA